MSYKEPIILEIGDIIQIPQADYSLKYQEKLNEDKEIRLHNGIWLPKPINFAALKFVVVKVWDASYNNSSTKNYRAKCIGKKAMITFALHHGWIFSVPSVQILGKHVATVSKNQMILRLLSELTNVDTLIPN